MPNITSIIDSPLISQYKVSDGCEYKVISENPPKVALVNGSLKKGVLDIPESIYLNGVKYPVVATTRIGTHQLLLDFKVKLHS